MLHLDTYAINIKLILWDKNGIDSFWFDLKSYLTEIQQENVKWYPVALKILLEVTSLYLVPGSQGNNRDFFCTREQNDTFFSQQTLENKRKTSTTNSIGPSFY